MTTEELLPGCQDRVDQGQEGTRSMTTVRIQSFLGSTFLLYTIVLASLILQSWREALVFNFKKVCHPRDCLPRS